MTKTKDQSNQNVARCCWTSAVTRLTSASMFYAFTSFSSSLSCYISLLQQAQCHLHITAQCHLHITAQCHLHITAQCHLHITAQCHLHITAQCHLHITAQCHLHITNIVVYVDTEITSTSICYKYINYIVLISSKYCFRRSHKVN